MGKHEAGLIKILKDKENALKACLESRDKEIFRLMTYEQVNNRILQESLAKRQLELKEINAKILDWCMKTVSNKKKVPLP